MSRVVDTASAARSSRRRNSAPLRSYSTCESAASSSTSRRGRPEPARGATRRVSVSGNVRRDGGASVVGVPDSSPRRSRMRSHSARTVPSIMTRGAGSPGLGGCAYSVRDVGGRDPAASWCPPLGCATNRKDPEDPAMLGSLGSHGGISSSILRAPACQGAPRAPRGVLTPNAARLQLRGSSCVLKPKWESSCSDEHQRDAMTPACASGLI